MENKALAEQFIKGKFSNKTVCPWAAGADCIYLDWVTSSSKDKERSILEFLSKSSSGNAALVIITKVGKKSDVVRYADSVFRSLMLSLKFIEIRHTNKNIDVKKAGQLASEEVQRYLGFVKKQGDIYPILSIGYQSFNTIFMYPNYSKTSFVRWAPVPMLIITFTQDVQRAQGSPARVKVLSEIIERIGGLYDMDRIFLEEDGPFVDPSEEVLKSIGVLHIVR